MNRSALGAPPQRPPAYLVVLLAALSALGPFSIGTYLPSFRAIGEAFSVGQISVQQSITAYALPFAVMALWHGAISDTLGRKRTILVFVGLYIVATLGAAFSTGIEQLWLTRALQGISAGAGMVVGRAVIRDLYTGTEAVRLMATVAMLFAMAPAFAPVIGGWIHAYLGWRAIFVGLALYALAIWLFVLIALPETLDRDQRRPFSAGYLWRSYRAVLGNRRFMALSAGMGLNFGGFFLYMQSASVFLIEHLGLTETQFGWLFVPAMSGMAIGSWLCQRLTGKWHEHRIAKLGYGLMLGAVGINIAIHGLLPPSLPWSLMPFGFYTLGNALVAPHLSVTALDLWPDRRGMAASCQSFLQTSMSAFGSSLVAPFLWATPLTLALGQGAFLMCGMSCAYYGFFRYSRGSDV